ncbi:MAG: hypothetical protein ACK4M9_07835 [Anaerobacillus sp.]|uniref:hypothetical protein n=1 Tax=Anaerobacillus sp. TaxID=1872506 RepID=UPI003918B0A5
MSKYLLVFFSVLLLPLQTVLGQEQNYLEEKYLPQFQEIEHLAVTSLNELINEAYIEYERKKENGEHTLPILFSYIEKGKKIERDIDLAFQSLLTEMKTEIKAKGLQEDIAIRYEQQYLKSKRKNKLNILKNITIDGPTIHLEKKFN